MNRQTILEEVYNSSLMDELKKVASGDMLQYFADHPQKLKEKLARDKAKKLAKSELAPRSDSIKTDVPRALPFLKASA